MQFIIYYRSIPNASTTHRERKIVADESIGDGTDKTRAYGNGK